MFRSLIEDTFELAALGAFVTMIAFLSKALGGV